jgi:hypothetical protein
MTSIRNRRAIGALATLLAAAAIALAMALSAPGTDPAAGAQHHHAAAAQAAKARSLHDVMRKLWEDHITWTRLAIVSFAHDLPDLPQTQARLLRNQTDIGNAVKPYYGRRAGNRLTALLKEHIVGAVDLLAAAKAGDAGRIEAARSAWYDNANRIAAFLHRANPRFWPLRDLRAMMRKHLDDTLDEAVARLEGRYADDIRAYERVHRHILMMADTLSAGIVRQFPGRFR